jgi:hypothetical protein
MVSFWAGTTDSHLVQSTRTSLGDHSLSSEMGNEMVGGGGGKWLFLRGFYGHGLKVHCSFPSRAKFKNVYAYNSSPTSLHIE